MESAYQLEIPLDTDPRSGPDWAQMTPIGG